MATWSRPWGTGFPARGAGLSPCGRKCKGHQQIRVWQQSLGTRRLVTGNSTGATGSSPPDVLGGGGWTFTSSF